jgi:hypothetical protein
MSLMSICLLRHPLYLLNGGSMRVRRHSSGCVRYDRRRKTWNYLWYEAGKRRSKLIGNKQQYPTKAFAWIAVERLQVKPKSTSETGTTVSSVIARYEIERMPSRKSTARVYRSFLHNHITPKWGEALITDLQPRRLSCGYVSCHCPRSPKPMCAASCTRLWSFLCGPGLWAWRVIPCR